MIPPRRRRTRWSVDSYIRKSDPEARIPRHRLQRSYLLDVVVAQGSAILELLSGENQSLLIGRDSFLVLDLGLDVVDGVGRLHLKGDSLTREGLDEAVGSPVSLQFTLRVFGFGGAGMDNSTSSLAGLERAGTLTSALY